MLEKSHSENLSPSRSAIQKAKIHPFSLQNTLRTAPAFTLSQKMSLWTALAVNAHEWALNSRIGIAWIEFSKASTVQECESWEARNNSFCPDCRKYLLDPGRRQQARMRSYLSSTSCGAFLWIRCCSSALVSPVPKCSAAFSPLTASIEISLPIYHCACAEAARPIFQPSWVRP